MDETNQTLEIEPVYPEFKDLLYPGEEEFQLEVNCFTDEKQEEMLWKARTGLNEDTLCGAIETIIFMSDKPVPLQKIKSVIDEDMPLRVVHEAISRLQEEYESKHHGLRLVEVAEGYQYRTKATYSKYVQDLFKVNSLVLSPTALEVLAIIAYKQPVAKTEVDKIRGVDSGHIVRGLMDKRLVKVNGRSDEMGRPVLYGTTPEFLEVFNLANLEQLPPESELDEMSTQSVGKISDIKSIVQTGDKEKFNFDEIDELDALAETIKEIASETDFTKTLISNDKKPTTEETAEGTVKKSAFDLLEEFVNREIILNANKSAIESEMMSGAADPQIISDLTAGPFNVPEVIEEDEEFMMVDLDTGLPITDEDESVVNEEDFDYFIDLELDEEISEETLGEEISLLGDTENEAEELSKALDDAFGKLMNKSDELDEDFESSELDLNDAKMLEREETIESLKNQIVEDAKDLDLDLSFLNDSSESENNTEM